MIYLIVFIIGGFLFYSVLYKSNLIPRFFSIWGIIADIMLLIGALLAYTIENLPRIDIIHLIAVLPIALNELVMSLWLIIKGFNPKVNT